MAMETTSQPTIPPGRETFVIGDVHGHLDRLKALLEKAEVGDKTVIQLGDLGHYGIDGNARDDADTWAFAHEHVHHVLWGNHDYALVNASHFFGGHVTPFYETFDMLKCMLAEGRVHFAMESYGFLLTHAGLAKAFMHQQRVPAEIKEDPQAFANWTEASNSTVSIPEAWIAVRDAISGYRGGSANAGGILWRDAREKLLPNFRQIFGHTAKDNQIRKYPGDHGFSYCIDIGTATNGRLAGIWLPGEEIVDIQV